MDRVGDLVLVAGRRLPMTEPEKIGRLGNQEADHTEDRAADQQDDDVGHEGSDIVEVVEHVGRCPAEAGKERSRSPRCGCADFSSRLYSPNRRRDDVREDHHQQQPNTSR